MSLSGCCRNLRITIKALLHLHLRRSSLYHRIQSRHLSSSSSMADLKSTFLNVYSTLKSDLLHDPSFEFTDESRLWVEKVHSFQILLRSVSWFSLSLFLSLFARCWITMYREGSWIVVSLSWTASSFWRKVKIWPRKRFSSRVLLVGASNGYVKKFRPLFWISS